MSQSRLRIVPAALDEANEFIRRHHRHHQPVIAHKFSIAVVDADDEIHGYAVVGRPVARMRDDGLTLEVTRLVSDGFPNACSALYAAAWRAAKALGYERIGTYILNTESGTSLKAAGWELIGERGGGNWNRPSRPRLDKAPLQGKLLWEKTA